MMITFNIEMAIGLWSFFGWEVVYVGQYYEITKELLTNLQKWQVGRLGGWVGAC